MNGNTGNINILAASLSIKVSFLLLGISHFANYKKLFLLVALFSVTTVIFLTGARTSLINLFLIFSIYITYLLFNKRFNKASLQKSALLLVPVIFAILFSSQIFKKSNDKSRYVSLENRVKEINTDDSSAKARLGYWNNILKISKTKPILGIGLGNYQIESIPYEKTTANDTNLSLHAHNDFLEILVETGIANSLIYLSLFVFVFITNMKKVLKSTEEQTRTIAILTILLVVIYGMDSLFNFPMYRPTMQLFFSLIIVLTITNNLEKENYENQLLTSKNKIVFLIFIIVSLLISYSALLITKASNLEYLINTDDINSNEKGFLTGDEVVRRIPKYPNVLSTSEAFYEYAGIYYVREKKYEKAMNCFSKANKINPYLGRINFYKYLISKEKGNLDSSSVYIKEAFYLRPRNTAFYKSSTSIAAMKQDTIEILKEHKLFSTFRKIPEAWVIAADQLQNAGYNRNNLLDFINLGLKSLPNDSTLLKRKNEHLIINYIIEGQNFESSLDMGKALKSYQKALNLEPSNVYTLQNLGFYYYNLGNYPEAIKNFLEALKQSGLENGKTEYYLAISYLKINESKNACKYFNISKTKKFADAEQQIILNCK
ncbi:O-antigen ligase family protein [Flavobacterium sp.]|uniref:O-antigen ligase family protein n=1 Tax=Flavobacterium sp. TaxID=239 RepID=UPI00374DB0A7